MSEFFTVDDFFESLNQLGRDNQKRIREKLAFFANQENPLLFAKKLKGHKDIFRFRVGDCRIVFQLSENRITLLLVKHRKDVYEGL